MERIPFKVSTTKNKNYIHTLVKIYLEIYQSLENLLKTSTNLTNHLKDILSYPQKAGRAER